MYLSAPGKAGFYEQKLKLMFVVRIELWAFAVQLLGPTSCVSENSKK